jgi:hypothetical protein
MSDSWIASETGFVWIPNASDGLHVPFVHPTDQSSYSV